MRYKGIIEDSTGTTIKNMMMKLKNPFPGNLNLQIAYAAIPLIRIFKTMVIAA